jgi:CSLREA domain-containing protein
MRMNKLLIGNLVSISLVLTVLLLPRWAQAANFTVNSTSDTIDTNPGGGTCADPFGNCTLRAAIMEANAFPGADVIILPAGTYILTISGTGEDRAGDLDIRTDQTIKGVGAASSIIDGGGIDRVLEVHATVQIDGVTVRNGNSPSDGGGILNRGTLTLNNSAVSNNSADTAIGSGGGGIANVLGTLTLNNSTVSNNSAIGAGGGILNRGTLTLNGSTVSTNSADLGGGILNSAGGRLIFNSSILSANDAANQGGGIRDGGSTTLTNVTVSGNSANLGGGIFRGGGTGPLIARNVTVSGNLANRGGGIYSSGTLLLKNGIVANSPGGNCAGAVGGVTSQDHNLDSDGTCGFNGPNDLVANPLLGPLPGQRRPDKDVCITTGKPGY